MKSIGTLLAALSWSLCIQAQVVSVTVVFDPPQIAVGATSTLRVYAQVGEPHRAGAEQILTWHLDLINLTPALARADYDTIERPFSDRDPRTSSSGKTDGDHRRGIFDTLLNTDGAGTTNRIELFNCRVVALAPGRIAFRVAPGSTIANLSTDFLVAGKGDLDPLIGGNYASARGQLLADSARLDTEPVVLRATVSIAPDSALHRVALSFNTPAGRTCYLEYQDRLSADARWQSLPGGPHNSGHHVDTNSVPSRFYRVRMEPFASP